MKKITTVFLSLALALGLSACGNNAGGSSSSEQSSSKSTSSEQSSASSSSSSTQTDSSSESTGETQSDTAKTLVVYFSGSGNTERVAGYIAQAAGADLFEITSAEPYSSADLNYNDKNSRVSREHDNESLRDVPLTSTEVSGWENYDTVFIGYPIWWGIAAWPVNSFVKANDFTGKTVIPFATSASSGMGESGSLLSQMAGSGTWQEGRRFRSSASEDDVSEWVNSLNV